MEERRCCRYSTVEEAIGLDEEHAVVVGLVTIDLEPFVAVVEFGYLVVKRSYPCCLVEIHPLVVGDDQ
ncbi:hypothetical protein WICPIJ_000864 [Wickerhamomyces pijperi]|uniref:Uncharacterized protein n=1 Tax=Wickerhamomyces pijperi TaxID=599730 RepID=A0A9P8QCX6_WICPI|nr:hypothetical protein WICPIJ_000864 [Wickerhamomyces pijperi]